MFIPIDRETYGFSFNDEVIRVADRFISHRFDEHVIESTDTEGTVPPFVCRFSKGEGHPLAVADEDGSVVILDTRFCGQQSLKHDWHAHANAIFDVAWVPEDGTKLLTASGDKTCALWDVHAKQKLTQYKGHHSSVKCVNFSAHNSALFASGSRDGHVMIWDTRVKQKGDSIPAVNVIKNPHAVKQVVDSRRKRKIDNRNDMQFAVTSVLFQDENTLISAGSSDGEIKVWDLRKTYTSMKALPVPRDKFYYGKKTGRSFGISSLVLDSSRTRLFASCMDSVVYQFDCAAFNQTPVCTYRGHQMASFYIKLSLSPDDAMLLSGSSDTNAFIWHVNDPAGSPIVLEGHSKEVSDVAWHPRDPCCLVTTSDDCTVRVWRTDPLWKSDGMQHEAHHIIGRASRTHRDIGVCTNSSTPSSTPIHHHSLRRHSMSTSRRNRSATVIPKQRIQPTRACASPRKSATAITYGHSPNLKSPRKIGQSPRKTTTPHTSSHSPRLHSPQKVAQSPRKSTTPHTSSHSPRLHSPRKVAQSPRKSEVNRTPKKTVVSPKSSPKNQQGEGEGFLLSPSKSLLTRRHLTPRKRTVPPCSPSKLTDQMRNALQSLTKNRPTEGSRPKPFSIQSWLSRPKLQTTASPRKLTISPLKKSPSAADKQSTPNSCQRKGAKRKLTDCYGGDTSSNKRIKPCADENDDISNSKNCSPVEKPAESTFIKKIYSVENENISKSEGIQLRGHLNELNCDIPTRTPVKQIELVSSPQQYSSPTANLPNFVLNPVTRTPISRVQTTPSLKTPDWLTQIKRKIVTPKRETADAPKTPSNKRNTDEHLKEIKDSNKTPRSKEGVKEANKTAGTKSRPKEDSKVTGKSSSKARSEKGTKGDGKTPLGKAKSVGGQVTPQRSKLNKTPLQKAASGSILKYLSPKQ